MVDRLDSKNIFFGSGDERSADEFVRHDHLIRSGMCPNGCGMLLGTEFGQECLKCKFFCNTRAEAVQSQ